MIKACKFPIVNLILVSFAKCIKSGEKSECEGEWLPRKRRRNKSQNALSWRQRKMADDEKKFSFQFVPNKIFPGFESSDVKELFLKW